MGGNSNGSHRSGTASHHHHFQVFIVRLLASSVFFFFFLFLLLLIIIIIIIVVVARRHINDGLPPAAVRSALVALPLGGLPFPPALLAKNWHPVTA